MQLWTTILSVLALGIYLTALIIWTALRRKINGKVWLAVEVGFVLLFLHRLMEMSGLNGPFSSVSALLIAIISFLSAFNVYKFVKRIDQIRKSIPIESDSVAERLANYLVHLRSKIEYYERKAEEYQIPKFPEE